MKTLGKYNELNSQQQVIYMKEAEAIFEAFDKMPTQIWEEEYDKYMTILEKYKEIKMSRWATVKQ